MCGSKKFQPRVVYIQQDKTLLLQILGNLAVPCSPQNMRGRTSDVSSTEFQVSTKMWGRPASILIISDCPLWLLHFQLLKCLSEVRSLITSFLKASLMVYLSYGTKFTPLKYTIQCLYYISVLWFSTSQNSTANHHNLIFKHTPNPCSHEKSVSLLHGEDKSIHWSSVLSPCICQSRRYI